MYVPLMSRATHSLPMLRAACSLRQCFWVVVSHTSSAGLLLRVQAHLKADSCLNMLWLLFLTPGPSRILQLSGLQHKHVHVMLLCNTNRRRLLSWYKLQTSPVICPENHLHPHPCDAAWEGRLLGKVRWKNLSLGTSLLGTGTNHASLICEFVIVGLLMIDCGEIPKASRPVARHDYGYVVLLGLLYMTKQPPHADCLYLLGPPKSRNNARSEIC